MSRHLALPALAAFIAAISFAAPAHAENVVVFDDPAFVGTGGTSSDESDTIQASLTSLGHTVTTFTGTSAAAWTAALAGKDLVVIPEQEAGNLGAALPAATILVIQGYISAGGGMIVSCDYQGTVNAIFGFTTATSGSGTSFLTGAAGSTQFATCPASIPGPSFTNSFATATLPAGSTSIYEVGGVRSVVALMPFGSGKIVHLGWDWFDGAPMGSQDGGWLSVLDCAVNEVGLPPFIGIPVAGTATWAQILANAGVVPPPPGAPVTTGGFQSVLASTGGLEPPDTHGSAGPDHLMTSINGFVRIQTKTGQDLGLVSLNQFFFQIAAGSCFDPKCFYDVTDGRWYVTCDRAARSAGAAVALAVSATSDPTGLWTFYDIDADPADTTWADHSRIGFNPTWICLSDNMYTNVGDIYQGIKLWVIDKATALAGGTLTVTIFPAGFDSATPGGGSFMLSPAVTVGSESTLYGLTLWNDSQFRMSQITGTGPAPVFGVVPGSTVLGGSGIFNTTTAFRLSGVGSPQLGSAVLLDGGYGYRTQDVFFRDGRLWTAHAGGLPSVGAVTRNVAVWHEIDPAAMVSTGAPEVQGGDTSGLEATFDHIDPSCAPNASRDMCLGFTRTSSTIFAEAARTFRLVSDGAGTLRPITTSKVGEASYVGGRWGDWSGTCVDPCDGLTFWTIQEYAANTASGGLRWATWWQRVSTQGSPTISTPANQTLEATGPAGRSVTLNFTVNAPGFTPLKVTLLEAAAVLGTSTVAANGPPATGVASITSTYSIGVHTLTAVVEDCTGGTGTTASFTVTIQDTTPPTVTATLSRTLLWTARNAMMAVGLGSSATDIVNPAPTFVSTRVFSDEAGATDATLTGVGPAATLKLRAKRKTNPAGLPAADGRVYLIVVRWTDGTNVGFTCKTVICPIAITATKLALANAQAAAASAFCAGNAGAAPAAFVTIIP